MITWSCVQQFEVLIRKLPSVDGFSSSSVVVGEISALKTNVNVTLQQHVGQQVRH